MIEKQKFHLGTARECAEVLKATLEPSCSRIMIAGSIRRGKETVGDIELLYIPRLLTQPDPADMFRNIEVNSADRIIFELEWSGILKRRPNKIGCETYGPKNKLMVHVASGIPVDLFSTTEENWWVSLVVRTGSKETNLRLTTGAQSRGRKLQAYGCGVEMLRDQQIDGDMFEKGEVLKLSSEREVFEACGVPYIDPENR